MNKPLRNIIIIIVVLLVISGLTWVITRQKSINEGDLPVPPAQQTEAQPTLSEYSEESNSNLPNSATQTVPLEQSIISIPLSGPVSESRSEISGMAWYGETLILLPQYPARFGQGDGVLFGLLKQDILAYLDGSLTTPLSPIEIPLSAPGIEQLQGYQGFEAIAFTGERVYLTIEAKPDKMQGYLITGTVSPTLNEIRLDPATLITIPTPIQIDNMTDEAILITRDLLLTLYEANGILNNPAPMVHTFSLSGEPLGTLPMANLEYRLTDVTALDENNCFWAINYFYPGDTKLTPDHDPLVEHYGEGTSHANSTAVERLVKFQYTTDGIFLSDTPPIPLQLLDDNQARNWEAIAQLDQRGLLIATDKFPHTIFAFVQFP